MIRLCVLVAIAVLACGEPKGGINTTIHGAWSAPSEPFRVVGNVYYVGARNIASYLITTSAGHILLDTGTKEMAPVIRANIAKLGFAMQDIEILLSNHAHYDHVQGHASLRRDTGARVLVMREDAEAMRTGTDRSPLGDESWEPVVVDHELRDGEDVTLGDVTLHAIRAPGHTPGCTVWTMTAREGTHAYSVVFYGCSRPNDSVQLVGNARFPRLIEDTLDTFARMRKLAPDIVLTMHPEELFEGKLERMRAGERPHPLDDPSAWGRMLDEVEADFAAHRARE